MMLERWNWDGFGLRNFVRPGTERIREEGVALEVGYC